MLVIHTVGSRGVPGWVALSEDSGLQNPDFALTFPCQRSVLTKLSWWRFSSERFCCGCTAEAGASLRGIGLRVVGRKGRC